MLAFVFIERCIMSIHTADQLESRMRRSGQDIARYVCRHPWGAIRGEARQIRMARELGEAERIARVTAASMKQDMDPWLRDNYSVSTGEIASTIMEQTVKALEGQGFNLG